MPGGFSNLRKQNFLGIKKKPTFNEIIRLGNKGIFGNNVT